MRFTVATCYLVPGSPKCVGAGICVVHRSVVGHCCFCWQEICCLSLSLSLSLFLSLSFTHSDSHARTSTGELKAADNEALIAGKVWRLSCDRVVNTAGKPGHSPSKTHARTRIHTHTHTRTHTPARARARIASFIPCVIPPSILNPFSHICPWRVLCPSILSPQNPA